LAAARISYGGAMREKLPDDWPGPMTGFSGVARGPDGTDAAGVDGTRVDPRELPRLMVALDRSDAERRFRRLYADLQFLKWVVALVAAGVGALVFKTFLG